MGFLNKEIGNGNFGILALIETHHRDEDDFPEEIKFHQKTHHLTHSPASEGDTHGGIIVIVANYFDVTDTNIVIPGRLINMKLCNKNDNSNINLSVFYGPMWHKMRKADIEEAISQLNDVIDADQNNLLMGDFNFVDSDYDRGKNMGKKDKAVNFSF